MAMKRSPFPVILSIHTTILLLLIFNHQALACGGFFCTTSPVDQNAERIIFTQNGDGTISAYVQIEYTGSAPDFSWILPLPSVITGDDLEIPEDAMAAFDELETVSNPVYIPPPFPDTCEMPLMAVAESGEDSGVEVFATGAVGPYGFDVVGSDDPDAMIFWLRDNEYRVTEEMEPLINVYVEEKMVFLAMRLLPDKEASDVEPIKITYRSERPMIPLRLTAVAANPDMRVLVWIYGTEQAVPDNYVHMDIPDESIQFFAFGGNNYRQLISDGANEHGGRAFVTEYAGSSAGLAVSHPLLVELAEKFPYVTRLSTVLSPEEMTVDPTFDYDPARPDVSNVHDLSSMKNVWDCEEAASQINLPINLPFFSDEDSPGSQQVTEDAGRLLTTGFVALCVGVVVAVGVLAAGISYVRKKRV